MGTNFYLHSGICECCGKADEIHHIGKSSMGWKFLFKSHKFIEGEQFLTKSYKDWEAVLSVPTSKIYDE